MDFGDYDRAQGPHRRIERHPDLTGTPCDINGDYLLPGTPPPPRLPPDDEENNTAGQWAPFDNRAEFELADFLYRQSQMPGSQIDTLTEILAKLYPAPDAVTTLHQNLR
ncbi:hypothetical protein PLICRDRAFT_181204 [Plicaturopsis crispa FD-325 SS-3]|uniref:Uncharacterized protein n=1 Tax=Plicaturopsis crispa FD-325 SS-3 TaxID=944288 RepID=A0A0C9SJV7_PLICR|nr:hypothetical protein PLICRDRAFT_181204 [Plicaturopsis crispa FD-325 SS-3]